MASTSLYWIYLATFLCPQTTLGGRVKGRSMQYHCNSGKEEGLELYSQFVISVKELAANSSVLKLGCRETRYLEHQAGVKLQSLWNMPHTYWVLKVWRVIRFPSPFFLSTSITAFWIKKILGSITTHSLLIEWPCLSPNCRSQSPSSTAPYTDTQKFEKSFSSLYGHW